MKTKPKDLGTPYETERAKRWRNAGLASARIAEESAIDQGDVWVGQHPDSEHPGWVEESKARANLNPHRTLHDAIGKAGHLRVLLAHKRLTRKEGNQRRTPDGLREIVAMHPKTAEVLLRAHERLRELEPVLVNHYWED